jgi:hypothetical protein
VLNWIDGPNLDMALRVTLVGLLVATGVLSVRLALAETRLAAVGRESAEMALERDSAFVELVRSHSIVAELEQEVVARETRLREESATAGLRLVAASTDLERFEAAAEAHETRMRALLQATDPRLVEGRIELANRMISEALRTRGA